MAHSYRFKAGDRIRFKTLEQLKSEGYKYDNRHVYTPKITMLSGMLEWCGKEAVIRSVADDVFHIEKSMFGFPWECIDGLVSDPPTSSIAYPLKIDCLENALLCCAYRKLCNGIDCSDCTFDLVFGTDNCESKIDEAIDFIRDAFGSIDDDECAEKMLKALATSKAPAQPTHIVITPTIDPIHHEETCSDCAHCNLIGDSFHFCDSFHNFTKPDGYCHNHEPKPKQED